jgi:GNAT superfamily N-acetyltransferase
MIRVREAHARDVGTIRDVFHACYGDDYPYAQFYDLDGLMRMVYSENQVLLVAEETETLRVAGTASVVLEIGAYADLVGEFGRLAVLPEFRNAGVGRALMQGRLDRTRDRLHVGLVEARIVHPFSWRISERHGFTPVGLLPLKSRLARRESLCLLAQHFGDALALRRNHPRVIPEVLPLAELALAHCGLRSDVIADEDSTAYHDTGGLSLREMTTEGYSTLLRIERGRVRRREVFGPLRLHYGLFKLQARRSHYFVALDGASTIGAVGWNEDPIDRAVRIFELIALDDRVTRFLLESLSRSFHERDDVDYVEIDVGAHAPRMQRTLLELGFLPVAYVPAMVFAEVERLDIVRMARLLCPPDFDEMHLGERGRAIADVVLPPFARQRVLPEIERAVGRLGIFAGLDAEQVHQLASACRVARFAPGDFVIREQDDDRTLYILLSGRADVRQRDRSVGAVAAGECLGEMSLLTGGVHSATARAASAITAASLGHRELDALVRQRPDIGIVIFRNLASGLGDKLARADAAIHVEED